MKTTYYAEIAFTAIRDLDDSSDLLYALGYNATDYIKPDGPDAKWFVEWIQGKYGENNK